MLIVQAHQRLQTQTHLRIISHGLRIRREWQVGPLEHLLLEVIVRGRGRCGREQCAQERLR